VKQVESVASAHKKKKKQIQAKLQNKKDPMDGKRNSRI
jgi:hypothetical protein